MVVNYQKPPRSLQQLAKNVKKMNKMIQYRYQRCHCNAAKRCWRWLEFDLESRTLMSKIHTTMSWNEQLVFLLLGEKSTSVQSTKTLDLWMIAPSKIGKKPAKKVCKNSHHKQTKVAAKKLWAGNFLMHNIKHIHHLHPEQVWYLATASITGWMISLCIWLERVARSSVGEILQHTRNSNRKR